MEKYFAAVSLDHLAAVIGSVNMIIEMLTPRYTVGWIWDHPQVEHYLPGPSKKTAGNKGYADISFTDKNGFTNVWEVKSSSYGAVRARNEAIGYAEAINPDPSKAGPGFPLEGIATFPAFADDGAIVEAWSPDFQTGGILYVVVNPHPHPDPIPNLPPNPNPVTVGTLEALGLFGLAVMGVWCLLNQVGQLGEACAEGACG